VAGGIDKELVTTQVRTLIDGLEATTATQQTRLEIAAELTDDLARLDQQIKASKAAPYRRGRCVGLVVDRHLRDRPSAGRDDHRLHRRPTRFANPDAYANYNGTAPIDRSSGSHDLHSLSRRGNRRLNHAIHMAAVTQIRFAHSPGRGYYDAKLAQSKTKKKALRALKRQLSNVVYRQLIADAQARR
jgi:transposase